MIYLYYYALCINNGTNICATFRLDIMVLLYYNSHCQEVKDHTEHSRVGGRKDGTQLDRNGGGKAHRLAESSWHDRATGIQQQGK